MLLLFIALLAGTLRTYQKAGCDADYIALSCPRGTSISIEIAQYGNTLKGKYLYNLFYFDARQAIDNINNNHSLLLAFKFSISFLIWRTASHKTQTTQKSREESFSRRNLSYLNSQNQLK